MARLIAPGESARVIRDGPFWTWTKRWHLIRGTTENIGICGRVCIDPEHSTLGEIKADELCGRCWPYEKE